MRKNLNLRSKQKLLFSFLILICVVILDIASKTYIAPLVSSTCNSGYALGVAPNTFNAIVSLVVIVAALGFLVWEKRLLPFVGASFVIAGGAANFFDRAMHGCVLDFISFFGITKFNLADSAITLGILILVYNVVFVKEGYE
ncbi:MAG: signal peptidase II [Candidatus Curtissbacteria bacterium]|nr:signal peptidase II [Candidatus Curtissbacteria bacterium]